jgi:nucleoside-diphosphate-sugar epimerase
MMSPSNYAIPPGSLVLVSGANGYIASQIVDLLLVLGFNVRGTVRSVRPWLDKYFQNKYGQDRYHSVIVPAIEQDGAFDEAVKGAEGFIHVVCRDQFSFSAVAGFCRDFNIIIQASDMSMNPNPEVVIPRTVKGSLNALEASMKHGTIKRFVLTSSSTAATTAKPNVEGIIVDERTYYTILKADELITDVNMPFIETWNLASIEAAWSKDTPIQSKAGMTYTASKTEQERTAWKWAEENKPPFVLNTILPNVNVCSKILLAILSSNMQQIGPTLSPDFPQSFMRVVMNVLKGDRTAIDLLGPRKFSTTLYLNWHSEAGANHRRLEYFIDVRDTARLHVLALLDPQVQSCRLFAFAHALNWTDIIGILRKLQPDNDKIPDAPENEGRNLSYIKPRKRAEELLQSFFGRPGWTPVEETLAASI